MLVLLELSFQKFTSQPLLLQQREFHIFLELITGRTSGAQAEVQLYDEDAEILKIFGEDYFELNEEIVGEKSGTVARIDDINLTDLYYKIDSSAVVVEGFNNNNGFLNSNEYKIQDSFYYQKFSYAIQSTVTENIWEEEVERLNHLVGWKRFSDMSIESQRSFIFWNFYISRWRRFCFYCRFLKSS